MRNHLAKFGAALSSFSASSDAFRVISSIPGSTFGKPPSDSPPATLYVLDSSFNPPTRAHLNIATSALFEDRNASPKRLLLLLATQNADKAPTPAAFEQRIMLMSLLADDIHEHYRELLSKSAEPEEEMQEEPTIDIGVTKLPYFHDKAAAISASGAYTSNPEQVHVVGFDTVIRIFNPKYYPPAFNLAAIDPFLSKHKLRVIYRTDADWGDHSAQEAFINGIADGSLAHVGGKPEWRDRILLVEGRKEGEEAISSSKVRECIRNGDEEALKSLLTMKMANWVLKERLYID